MSEPANSGAGEGNVEFVRGLLEAVEGADKQQLLAALPAMIAAACDPQIEFVETPERIDARTYRGHDGVLEAFTRWLEQWERYSFEVERIEGHGEKVLVVASEAAEGQASGAPGNAILYAVYTVRNDKITRYEEFYDEQAALAVLA